MSVEKEKCIFCGTESDKYRRARHSYTEYDCPQCGPYAISDFVNTENFRLTNAMYYYLLHYKPCNDKYTFFVQDASRFTDNEANYVGEKTLLALYPDTFSERVEKTLLNLSKLCHSVADDIVLFTDQIRDTAIIEMSCFCENEGVESSVQECSEWLTLLSEMGYLKLTKTEDAHRDTYKITAKGWLKIQELQTEQKEINQGFVAMWFSDSMSLARQSIIKAINECGYQQMIIDTKEHNNQIVPEIFYEIGNSRFVVADLTGHRHGVYYEAGYAQAQGKEVIMCCRQSDFDKRHFDVSQKNMIVWQDEEDLFKRLVNRIEATVGRAN